MKGQETMSIQTDYSGRAALTIIEALLLAINDHNILPEKEILGILSDSAATHDSGVGSEEEIQTHRAVSALINRIIAGGNSVRRP